MLQDSSNAFDRPLRAELGRSRTLALLLTLPQLLAVCGWLLLPVSWPLRLGVSALLAANALYLWRLHVAATLPLSVQALGWDAARGWRLRSGCGHWEEAELLTPAFVSYRLVALRFRLRQGLHCNVLVCGDRIGADAFRRLRVRLLQSAHGDRDRANLSGA